MGLHINADHKDFSEHYRAARRGIKIKPDAAPADNSIRGSVVWLTLKHLDDLANRVNAGLASPLKLKKRQLLFSQLRKECGEYSMQMLSCEIMKIRDKMAETPAWADSMVEVIRNMYRWDVEPSICDFNPAVGIGKIDRGKGGKALDCR